MKTAVAILTFAAFALAQDPQPRALDNFDRAGGIIVYLPPPPPAPKRMKRVRQNGRWVMVPVEDSARTRRTASSASVYDGLASREGSLGLSRTRLAMGSGSTLKGFTTGNHVHDALIVESSIRYRIDPLLIYAQMHQESSFKIKATSHKGASGLMQLMPGTARRFGVTKIYDPKQNIDAGVRYMRWLLDLFEQDVVLALAGYNAGEGAVLKYGRNIPPYRETQEYVRRITSRYHTISDPQYINSAHATVAKSSSIAQKDSRPLTVYEPAPLMVRLPDGQMMLVNR